MKQTQTDRILAYLKRHGSISDAEARDEIGCTRLAARVLDLRKAQWNIETERRKGVNRYGEVVHFGVYTLVMDDQFSLAI